MSVVQKLEQYKKQLVASRKVVDEDTHIKEIIDTYLSESGKGRFNFREISRIFDILAIQTETLLQDKELLKLVETNKAVDHFHYIIKNVDSTIHERLSKGSDAFIGIKDFKDLLKYTDGKLDLAIKSLS